MLIIIIHEVGIKLYVGFEGGWHVIFTPRKRCIGKITKISQIILFNQINNNKWNTTHQFPFLKKK